MSFKKLALVTAMFAATSGAYAMEALDDESMAAATGQDGITVTITVPSTGITMGQVIHDKDGWTAAMGNPGTAYGGAIVIGSADGNTVDAFKEMKIVRDTDLVTAGVQAGALNVTLDIDADGGDATGTTPYLNVKVGLQAGMTITTGDIRVASSAASAAGGGIGSLAVAPTYTGVIMKSMDIVLGATDVNIQLGNEPQGAMIKLDTTMGGGLTINGMELADAGGAVTGGSIYMASQHIYNAGGSTDLTIEADINVSATGLQVALTTFGDAVNGASVDITGVRLGAVAAANIGDIEIRGLNLNGTAITIAGH